MSEVKGVVEAVSKTNKGVKINGAWYNSAQPLFEGVKRGQTVSFQAETNDQGSSFVKRGSPIDVTGSGSGSGSAGGGGKAKANSYEVGAATGMAVNNAILLAISAGKGLDEDYIKQAARKVYGLAESLKEEFGNPKPEPAVSPPPSSSDEENPFID